MKELTMNEMMNTDGGFIEIAIIVGVLVLGSTLKGCGNK